MRPLRDLDRLPGSPQLHRWADWAELLCASSLEGGISIPDIAEAVEVRIDDIPTETSDAVEPGESRADELSSVFESPDQFKDAVTRRAADVFSYLLSRSSAYGDNYPFTIDDVSRTISVRQSTSGRSLYLFLLQCSTFRYIMHGKDQTDLSARFEGLGLAVLRKLGGPSWQAHLFGSNAVIRDSRYNGKLVERIELLAQDLNETMLATPSEYEAHDYGDGGLDLVSWFPFSDGTSGLPIAFGQAACTPAWVQKQHSSGADAWRDIIRFKVLPQNYCFIPFDFRRPSGDWYSRKQIHNSVLLDRRRIMSLIVDPAGFVSPELIELLELSDDASEETAA